MFTHFNVAGSYITGPDDDVMNQQPAKCNQYFHLSANGLPHSEIKTNHEEAGDVSSFWYQQCRLLFSKYGYLRAQVQI